MNILLDIMGLIARGRVKPPEDTDYLVVASYMETKEVLKPQPKMQANLITVGALKKLIQPSTYKTFVGLVTQTGIYPTISKSTPAPFVIGNTYYLIFKSSGDDFSNVGYVQDGVPFIATGTTPTTWTGSSQVREILPSVLPIITPIQNTLGVTLTPSFRDGNTFFLNSDLPVFLISNTLLFPFGTIYNDGSTVTGGGLVRFDDSTLISPSITLGQVRPFIIKIEVYEI